MRHEESTLQIGCVDWFRTHYPDLVIMAIPNGGNRNIVTAAIMKREGVLAGAGDLFLTFASHGYHGLWIEMKTKKGKQSESQKEFQKKQERLGYKYVVCRSFEEFRNEINNYMHNENN